eukprot:gene38951-52599_t
MIGEPERSSCAAGDNGPIAVVTRRPMAKRPATAKKTLSAANLKALGDARLADLLMEMAGEDAGWKRRLRMELAAEVGAADLALEIDKRLNTLATSRAKVSWRKRPELLADLATVRRMIVDRLAAMDARLGLDRLVVWFDLYPGLASRVKDPKVGWVFNTNNAPWTAAGSDSPIKAAATPAADAFNTAQSFPNLFRRIFAEGAFTAAFVPTYSKVLASEGQEAADKLATDALATLAAMTLVLTIAFQLAMPWLMLAINPGFGFNSEKYRLA